MAFAVHVRISCLCSGDVSALHRGRTWELDGGTWSVFLPENICHLKSILLGNMFTYFLIF